MKFLRSAKHLALVAVIVAARDAANLSQREFSARLKKSKNFISKIEAYERQVNALELIEIAQALGLSAAELITQIELKGLEMEKVMEKV